MSTIVLNVSETIMQEIQENYNQYYLDKTPAGSLFMAKLPGCTITGYRTGKVMFQGKEAEKEAEKWRHASSDQGKKPLKKQTHRWHPPVTIATQSIIGSDEVGTGDYFGPIAVAAAFVSRDQLTLFAEWGVKDSKKLSDEKISRLAKKLFSIVPHSLLVLPNKKYNDLQRKGMTQGKMKALLHNRALLNVQEKILHVDGILIDQFVHPDIYFRHIAREEKRVTSAYFAEQAEALHLSVAVASILARDAFLKEINKLSERFGITLPKGAGTQVDEAAARLIEKEGEAVLEQCAKLHFANTEKAKQLVKRDNHHR